MSEVLNNTMATVVSHERCHGNRTKPQLKTHCHTHIVTYHLEIDDGVLHALVMDVRELYHDVHEVGVPFFPFIDHLNLSEGQAVKPVQLGQLTIAVFPTQLKQQLSS